MQMNQLAEQVAAARAGDRDATNALFTALRPKVIRYCRARIRPNGHDHTAADDVAQEVFAAVLASLHRFRGGQEASFLSFVFGIAANKVADHHRARSRDRAHLAADPVDSADPQPGPEQRVLRAELGERMRELLGLLTEAQREILVLRVAAGLSAAETATIVGSTPAAVRVAQHRALQRLRRHLDGGDAGTMRPLRADALQVARHRPLTSHGMTAGLPSSSPT